ncbi:MAG: NIPSNAP family protein [Ferrovibrionaceae bacterium]
MLIEQITYVLLPGRAPALVAAYEDEGLAVIGRNLGRLVAFLTSEVGGMDEVSHLWAFADAADREVRHARLQADPGWKAFTSTHGHLLVSRRNCLWRAAPFSPGL